MSELTVNYGRTSALWDLNFVIPAGQLVGIVGPNGAGKSTLLKAGLGMVTPVSGSIRFFDEPYRRVRRRIAYVPQRESVDWDFPITLIDLVLMGRYGRLGPFRRPSRRDREAAMRALDMVGLAELHGRQIGQLSGGQQQRAFLARALMQEADLYLLDEPFSGVDMASEQVLIGLMRGLRDAGKTLLVVHHDLTSVEKYFDSLVLLNMHLVAAGSVAEVFTQANLEVAYGKGSVLFGEAVRLSQTKTSGLR